MRRGIRFIRQELQTLPLWLPGQSIRACTTTAIGTFDSLCGVLKTEIPLRLGLPVLLQ